MKKNSPTLLAILVFITVVILLLMYRTPNNIYRPDEKYKAILRSVKAPALPENSLSILEFGALGDSVTDCRPAFEKAMQACRELGGARIVVPRGQYFLDGPIHLVSNVCLDLQEGAELFFSSNPASYLPVVRSSWEGTFLYNYSPFIYGYQLKNISIIGKGSIDGRAADSFALWAELDDNDQALSREMNYAGTPIEDRIFGEGHFLRPQLIQLFECKNVLIEGVLLKDSPFWCLHLLKSENITVKGIRFSAFNKNNDGIDPEYSRNVLIENVQFNNSDDNVAIKAGRDYEGRKTNTPSENIIIRNCSFKGLHAVVIGSEMSSGVRNVFVRDCDHGGYLKRGIYLKSNPDRGGYIKHVYVDNLKLGTVEDCFFITSNYQNQGKGFETEIREIHVNNLHCEKAENAGIVIQGFATKKVSDIYLSNVNIKKAAVGLFMEHAENIVFDNVISGGRVGAPSTAKTGDIERIRQQ